MAITVDYVVLHHLKKSNGTNFIRIRITHKRKSKYIKTNIVLEPEDFSRSGNLRHQGKKDLADDEVRKYRRIVEGITTSASEAMDVDDVLRYVNVKLAEGEEFHLNFASFGILLAQKKKPHTGRNYLTTMRGLVRFFGHEPDISEITVRSMRAFEEFIRNEPKQVFCTDTGTLRDSGRQKNGRAVNQYMSVVKSVYRAARLEYNDPDTGIFRIPVDIFDYYTIPKAPPTSPRDIPAEWVQMMIDQRKGLTGLERLGVDVFLISFGLQGINIVDMYNVTEKPKEGVLHYFRTKTKDSKGDGAEMFVRIEPCIADIMKDYLGKERVFSFYQRYVRDYGLNVAVNDGLKKWSKRNGLGHFTFYSARHTWPTLAASKRLQIDSAVITDALCHSDQSRRMDKVYTRTDWERVWDANAKVLGLFEWK